MSSMIVLLQCTECEEKNSLIIKLFNHFITPIKVIEHGSVGGSQKTCTNV